MSNSDNNPTDNRNATDGRSRSRTILTVAAITLLAVVSVAVWRTMVAPRGEAIAKIIGKDKDPGMLSAEQQPLGRVVFADYEEFRNNTIRWSAAYFSCLFLSAVFSAASAFVLKLKAFSSAAVLKEDLAALLAVLAGLLITLSTVGDFQRKWQANRIAASSVESVAYDLIQPGFGQAEKTNIISRLKEISTARNSEIVGSKPDAGGDKGSGNKLIDKPNSKPDVNKGGTQNVNPNTPTNIPKP